MAVIRLLKILNRDQRNTFVACFLGWALDALDFFLVTFVLVPLGHDFGQSIAKVTFAITLTLMMRPVGAFIFGWLGDKFGRRIPLMVDIIFYSVMELLTAFAPNFTVFLILRALFGIGMGGEWGLGASLAMESLPTAGARTVFGNSAARLRGWLSARGACLLDCVSAFRLARIVCRRRDAGAAGDLYPRATCRNRRCG